MSQLPDRTLNYYRQQQVQPGWFDLLSVMIHGMLHNAGERESQAFLQQMGDNLARRYPLGRAATVSELEARANQVLARFGWGVIDIQPYETALVIDHVALPPGDSLLSPEQWQQAFAAVLLGLYARWLREQGGREHVALAVEASGETALRFRYQV